MGCIKSNIKFLAIPGCHNKLTNYDNNNLELQEELRTICWRFCGGFFWGDKSSLVEFYKLYIENFPLFIERYKTLVWEVNFWAWLELNFNWSPNWYLADHNDSIIDVPYAFTSMSIKLSKTFRTTEENYIDKNFTSRNGDGYNNLPQFSHRLSLNYHIIKFTNEICTRFFLILVNLTFY
jgi:hypothetical protein